MKKTLIPAVFVLAAALSGCNKSHNCSCMTTDTLENAKQFTTINMKKSNSCGSITQLGFEKQRDTVLVRTMHPVICEEVDE